jgi:hypothetical protein
VKLSKNIRYLVRVRDFETVHIEVGAEADHHDLGYSDQDWSAMLDKQRTTNIDHLELLVIEEVDRLARRELEAVAEWSEISPNLAEDYLETKPAYLQRSQHAYNKKTDPPASGGRRIRRGGGGTPPSTSPPTRPAA